MADNAQDLTTNKSKKSPWMIVAIILAAILVALFLFMVILNATIKSTYSDFYENSEVAFQIPGIDEGFVPQDLDYIYEDGSWLFSGYVSSGGSSPIYRKAEDGTVTKLFLQNIDGSEYDGHGSAITSNEAFAFLACDGGMLVFDLDEILTAENGNSIKAKQMIEMDFSPAFMNIQNDILYAGNFYLEGPYNTPDEHHLTTPDGTENGAVMYAFYPTDMSRYGYSDEATCVYSIPGKVQGMCITPDDELILSTSYGLDSSHLLMYDFSALEPEDTFTANGNEVDLYYLDSRSAIDDFLIPPMSEGIVFHDGRIYVCEESASNKYIFGKLYGAGKVYAFNPLHS